MSFKVTLAFFTVTASVSANAVSVAERAQLDLTTAFRQTLNMPAAQVAPDDGLKLTGTLAQSTFANCSVSLLTPAGYDAPLLQFWSDSYADAVTGDVTPAVTYFNYLVNLSNYVSNVQLISLSGADFNRAYYTTQMAFTMNGEKIVSVSANSSHDEPLSSPGSETCVLGAQATPPAPAPVADPAPASPAQNGAPAQQEKTPKKKHHWL